MPSPRARYLLVLDLEATCSNNNRIPRSEMVSHSGGTSFQILDEFNIFVKPTIHPKLTFFCTNLTSIKQSDVDDAVLFPKALSRLTAFIDKYGGPERVAFCSWGDYDRNQFVREGQRHGLELPFGDHFNVKRMFASAQGLRREPGLQGALKRKELRFVGTAHRGIDDARNVVRLLPFVGGGDEGMLYCRDCEDEVEREGKEEVDEEGTAEA